MIMITNMEATLIHAFISGFILALGLILPLGAQNTYVLSQGASNHKYLRNLPVIITAAMSDTCLILLAVGGFSLILLAHIWLKTILVISGIAFMGYIGWSTWHSTFGGISIDNESSVFSKIFFTLSVSILNPYAILDTLAIIGTSSVAYNGLSKTVFTLACIIVSWLWFFFLSTLGRVLRNFALFSRIQGKISAIIIWANALVLIYKFI